MADEEHGAAADRRRSRIQYIIDPEISVGLDRDDARVVQYGLGNLAKQRGAHALARVGADAIAAREQQAASSDPDAAVRLHVGPEIGDRPELARRLNSTDDFPVHALDN